MTVQLNDLRNREKQEAERLKSRVSEVRWEKKKRHEALHRN